MHRPLLLALVTATLAGCIENGHRRMGNSAPQGRGFFEWTRERHDAGDYLGPIEVLENSALLATFSPTLRMQILGTEWSMLGENVRANILFDHGMHAVYGVTSADQAALLDALDVEPAVEGLCQAAHGRRLLIISEEHHAPVDRAFGDDLLDCLSADGFDTLAAEALEGESVKQIEARGYIARGQDGAYPDEPRMARLLDHALKDGFQLLRYDELPSCKGCTVAQQIELREQGQADRISAYMNANPSARLVVWCGYDHAFKRQRPQGDRWMAARVWEQTGVEPYSVRQVSGHLGGRLEENTWTAIDRGAPGDGPVFADIAAVWDDIPAPFRADFRAIDPEFAAADAIVVHRRRSVGDSRSQWLEKPAEESHAVAVDCDPDRHPRGLVVQLFPDASHAADAVPSDQVLAPCRGRAELVAEAGAWYVVVRDEGEVLFEKDTELAASAPLAVSVVMRNDHWTRTADPYGDDGGMGGGGGRHR